jgi:hypothetical protein
MTKNNENAPTSVTTMFHHRVCRKRGLTSQTIEKWIPKDPNDHKKWVGRSVWRRRRKRRWVLEREKNQRECKKAVRNTSYYNL